MKLVNILLGAAAGAVAYTLVSNREKILSEIDETTALISDAQSSYQNIQDQIANIQSMAPAVMDTVKDIRYKVRVYQQETQGHLSEIKRIQDKYNSED